MSVAKAICACVDRAKQAQLLAERAAAAAAAAASKSENDATKDDSIPQVSPVVIGADDLLLLFTYLLLRTGVPSLLAELAFLGDFIPDHQRCTMQGYYLATANAAAELLTSEQFQATIAKREGQASTTQAETEVKEEEKENKDENATRSDIVANSSTSTSSSSPTNPLEPLRVMTSPISSEDTENRPITDTPDESSSSSTDAPTVTYSDSIV